MKNKMYCYQVVMVPGSPLYYALKTIPEPKRDVVVGILALYKEIEKVVFKETDLTVINSQLQWFRNDLVKQSPEHPVSLFLQAVHPEPMSDYLELINGLEQNRNPTPFLTFEELVIHIMRTAGLRDVLIAKHLLSTESIELEMIYQFTLVTELVHYLQMIRSYLRIGKICFAMPDMQRCQVTASMLYQYQTSPAIYSLFKLHADKVKAAYATLSKQTPLRYFTVRAKMAYALLNVMEREHYHVLENLIQLTPIKHWWLSLQ